MKVFRKFKIYFIRFLHLKQNAQIAHHSYFLITIQNKIWKYLINLIIMIELMILRLQILKSQFVLDKSKIRTVFLFFLWKI